MSNTQPLVILVQEISRTREAREIYQPALAAISAILGAKRSSILLLDHQGIARFVAWRGLSDAYRAAVEGHFPWALDDPDPRPIIIPDVDADAELRPYEAVFRAERIRALAFIPLIYRERLVGKFMLYFADPHELGASELEMANAVAYLVAFAIERARLYAEIEASDQRKDVFLATLAHELRNPLAPALAAIGLMDEDPGDLTSIGAARGVLGRSLRHIVKLVDDLLDVSRVTRGVIVLEKQPVDLTSIVHHAVATLQPQIGARRHSLTLALIPIWLEADPLRLEQVISNLIHNAVKYTPNGGNISVLTATTRDGGAEIRVRDNGIGLAAEIAPRVFDLFVQVDQSLARSSGGLGIGLTIVRKLVELHGGTVTATSDGEGHGSEFIVILPGRIPAPKRARSATGPDPRSGPRHRILIVDDNEDAAHTLALLLGAWGHEVAIASDGRQALDGVTSHRPDVVLLDLGLPVMNGFEVAAALRARGERDVRIIAVSGYGQPSDLARSREAGCDAHLVKPVDRESLWRVLAGG